MFKQMQIILAYILNTPQHAIVVRCFQNFEDESVSLFPNFDSEKTKHTSVCDNEKADSLKINQVFTQNNGKDISTIDIKKEPSVLDNDADIKLDAANIVEKLSKNMEASVAEVDIVNTSDIQHELSNSLTATTGRTFEKTS
ncbi:hypothetical protein CDIK_3811 [Cucumispora dikerogammari]|nr:hypothetical protein CDIK_3811 [Cucumispora dikerogammari]